MYVSAQLTRPAPPTHTTAADAVRRCGGAAVAGDVLLFTEAATHGTLPWKAQHQRRVVIYRFAPATMAYGRAYTPSWPAAMMEVRSRHRPFESSLVSSSPWRLLEVGSCSPQEGQSQAVTRV